MIKKIISLIGLFFSAVSVTAILLVTIAQFLIPPNSFTDLLVLEVQFLTILVVGLAISKLLITSYEIKKYFGIFNIFFGSTFIFATILILFRSAVQVDQIMTFGATAVLQFIIGMLIIRMYRVDKSNSKNFR
jgi:hypothetical protein